MAKLKIRHRNLSNIVNIEKSRGIIHIIMEYCNGSNLDQLIERRGYLSEKEVYFIIK